MNVLVTGGAGFIGSHLTERLVHEGARVRARGTLLQARRRAGALLLTSEVRIEVEGEHKPACVAEILGMYFLKEAG